MVVVWLINPPVAVIVTFDVPVVTMLDAVSVNRLVPGGGVCAKCRGHAARKAACAQRITAV